MANQITLYLPLRITDGTGMSNRNYVNNVWRTQLLIKSLDKYFASPVTMMIVSPSTDLPTIQAQITGTSKITLTFIDQETILPGITASTIPGWYKQQILSLAVAVINPTLTILKLDPDLILVENIDHPDFFQGSKTGNEMWRIQANNLVVPYIECTKLLRKTIPNLSWGLKWTPFILNPMVTAALISQLQANGISLLDLGTYTCWTETLLYNIMAGNTGTMTDYHFNMPLIGSTLKQARQIPIFKIKPAEGIFATLQGYTGVTEDQVNMILAKSGITF
jgi:hypothetical protein